MSPDRNSTRSEPVYDRWLPTVLAAFGLFSAHIRPSTIGVARERISWRPLQLHLKWSRALPIILVILLSACGRSGLQPKNPPVTPPPAEVKAAVRALDTDGDGTITFQGVVLENDHGCEVDGWCVLRIDVDGHEFDVVYHYGEWPPCQNNRASQQGFGIVAGDRVEVHAGITDDGDLSTCDKMEFYIKKMDAD